ncbi:MAG: ligase-associated DNA damage response endonuclease PdeM [Flavobacteriaceae bacterium]|nr:ligase-associated DNA damage response endonuclease PdeM [Flavobacteriaceae bacterium]
MIITKEINCFNNELVLTNQRALFWKAENSLILSDLHIGKSAHFQKSGIAIPSSILNKDLQRLADLIFHFKANKLIIVGDLFHADYNKDLDEFKQWLTAFKDLKIILVKGNHDRLLNSIYEDFNIEVHKTDLKIGTIKFVHDNVALEENYFSISGHIHPGVAIKTKGKQRIKLPCYQVTKQQLILPAFSLFTGLNTRDFPEKCTNYAFTNDAFFEL